MNKKALEKSFIGMLFILVLVIFSFAQRDSKKIERLYITAQLLHKAAQAPAAVSANHLNK